MHIPKTNPREERALLLKRYSAALLPAMRLRAEQCGYAIGVHGSECRDLDLIAVPWRDHAVDSERLIEAMYSVVKAVIGDVVTSITEATARPQGRKAWVIHLTPDNGNGPYLDISVMPTLPEVEK